MRGTRNTRFLQIFWIQVIVTAMLVFFVTTAAEAAPLSPAPSDEQEKDELGSSLSPCLTPADKSAGILLGRWCGDLQATALNSSGQLLLVSDDDDFDLRDFASGKLIRRYVNPIHDSKVKQLLFPPDSSHFAALYHNRKVLLWKTTGDDNPVELTSEGPKFNSSFFNLADSSLAFSPDSSTLAVQLKKKNTLLLWDIAANKQKGFISPTEKMKEAREVSFSPDSKLVFWAGSLWDIASMKKKQVLGGDEAVFSHDGTKVASMSTKAIDLWEVSSGKKVATLVESGAWIWQCQFTADGKVLVMKIFGGKKFPLRIVFWDILENKYLPLEVSGSSKYIIGAKGESIFCTSEYGGFCEINIHTGDARIVHVPGEYVGYNRFIITNRDILYWWSNMESDRKLFKKITYNANLNALDIAVNGSRGFTLSGKIDNAVFLETGDNIKIESYEYLDQQVRVEKTESQEGRALFPGKYRFSVSYMAIGGNYGNVTAQSVAPVEFTAELMPGRRYSIKAEFPKNGGWRPILVEEKDEK